MSRNKKPQGASPTDRNETEGGSVPPVPTGPSRSEEGAGAAMGRAATPTPPPNAEAGTSPVAAQTPTPHTEPMPAAQPEALPTQGPSGRYGPQVRISGFDVAPDELTWQLPINGELYRVIPGPDRPDYSIMLLERPLHFYPGPQLELHRVDEDLMTEDRQGRTMVRAHALVLCARFTGQQLHPGMADFPVNVAAVIANSVLSDPSLDFDKISYAAVGFLSQGHAEVTKESPPTESPLAESPLAEDSAPAQEATGPQAADQPGQEQATVPQGPPSAALPGAEPVAPEPVTPEPEPVAGDSSSRPPTLLLEDVLTDVALTLRQGICDERGTGVAQLQARLTLDAQHRIVGLSGNADGAPPAPTRETFDRINTSLGRLSELPPGYEVTGVTVTVTGDEVTYEVEYSVE